MLGQQGSLSVVVHTASNLHNVETFGKQDPYVQFAVTLEDKHAFQKTFTAKDAGKEASWNQSFELPLRGEPDLYIEVLDEEKGADELIGFAAVPLNQVVQSPGGAMRGQFDIYTVKGENAGSLQLTLTSRGFNSPPGQQQQQIVQGRSYISEEHLKRVKSLRNKGIAGDVGGALFGAALAVGAGYVGNKVYQDHKQKQQEEEERRQQDEQRRQEEEKQRQEYERNRSQLDEERERFEREKREEEERRRREQQEAVHRHHGEGDQHRHHEEHHHHHHGSREFDPVGTYAAGDRVEYHGREYLCLQSHTSNPTWDPSNAPSLWRTC